MAFYCIFVIMSYLSCTNKQQFWSIRWGNCAIKTPGSLRKVTVLVRWQKKKNVLDYFGQMSYGWGSPYFWTPRFLQWYPGLYPLPLRKFGFELQICCWLTLWSWTSHLNFSVGSEEIKNTLTNLGELDVLHVKQLTSGKHTARAW